MRTAGLWPCSRKPFAAKGLAANNGPDLVAIDIDVACVNLIGNGLDTVINPRLQPKGQTISSCVYVIDNFVQFVGVECADMQNGAENFAL